MSFSRVTGRTGLEVDAVFGFSAEVRSAAALARASTSAETCAGFFMAFKASALRREEGLHWRRQTAENGLRPGPFYSARR